MLLGWEVIKGNTGEQKRQKKIIGERRDSLAEEEGETARKKEPRMEGDERCRCNENERRDKKKKRKEKIAIG